VPWRGIKSFTLSNRNQIETLLDSWSSTVPVQRARTLPSGFYTSRDLFEIERHAIFGQNWLWAGRRSQFQNVGDFISGRFLSEPYLINLDASSTLRAHYNVCCHHGMCLTEKSQGRAERGEFVCPYHGWTYDLTGSLKKALRLKTIEDFKASKTHLRPIGIRTIGPFVYLNFNFPQTNELVNTNDCQHIEHIHEKYLSGSDYEQFEFVNRRSYEIKCNWKVFIDNYLDGGYHVPHAHKQLSSILNMKEYKTIIDHPRTSVQSCTGTERTEGQVIFAFIYPNLLINRYGSLMDTNIVVPIDERHCLVHIDYYRSPQLPTIVDEELSRQDSHRVQEEDIHLCENVQIGLESNAYDVGRYVPTVEHAMHDFHKTLFEEIKTFYQQNSH
jgi:choline monooxygenase